MFLVKSCTRKYNVCNSKTLKIGTLHEYRETESEQIADKEEGFFNIFFDIKDKFIDVDLFNHLNNVHNSDLRAYVENLHIKYQQDKYIRIDYRAKYNWVNNNRFIFCISKLNDHEDSKTIFPDYDDYWYVSYFKRERFIEAMEKALLDEIIKKLKSGDQIFQKPIDDPNNLTVKSHYQDILYSDRDLYLDNHNIDSMQSDLIDIFKNIKYLKPERYNKEYEFRIVFDFYEEGVLLHPIVKSIIIPDNISHLIKQPDFGK
ncbi:hypothetical protein LN098_003617 [Acinetobacter baumannii]|nr:hypothetical protein [Acinetobacter baumannii]EHU2405688.1 hypothetical protein [Acinetobacter baumannii]EKT8959073.1 hypothetical protein [Acinetobacter baumannii]EKT8966580.1 hypothetical protein [Acinetobacter baumannii]EKT8970339.1 hypothetical protein [Acinetobacter baumannii]EKT9000591.1 hypothetical protein [Acinetobacter baumannii]